MFVDPLIELNLPEDAKSRLQSCVHLMPFTSSDGNEKVKIKHRTLLWLRGLCKSILFLQGKTDSCINYHVTRINKELVDIYIFHFHFKKMLI